MPEARISWDICGNSDVLFLRAWPQEQDDTGASSRPTVEKHRPSVIKARQKGNSDMCLESQPTSADI